MANKLTYKQTKFIKAKAEGKSGTQAAKEAYNVANDNVAGTIAVENMQKPRIQEALQKEMERQGITLEKIIRPITDGLMANKVHIVGLGDQAMAEVVPDHGIRLKSSGMAQMLLGVKNETGGNTYNFIGVAANERNQFNI